MTGTPPRFTPDFLTQLLRDPLDPAYAAAARRRAVRGPGSRLDRVASRAISLVAVAAVGFLFAVAYQQVVRAEPESSRTRTGLVKELRSRQATTDELTERAERLRDEVDRQRDAALDIAEVARLRTLAAASGLGRVRGDGAVVELRDAPDARDPVTGEVRTNNLGRVQDRDLQAVANALWHAGAEAVAINGQRLSSTSTIRAAGAAILVDFRPISGPYQVSAIGPGDLDRRFNESPTGELFRQLARRYNMSVQVRSGANLTLPAATDPQLVYARPPSTVGSPVPSASGGR